MLTTKPWLWPLLLAALDIQIRAFLNPTAFLPAIVYSLVCRDVKQYPDLQGILQAMTLVNEPGFNNCGPILQMPQEMISLDKRLYLLCSESRSTAKKLSNKIQAEDSKLKRGCGSFLGNHAFPIFLSQQHLSLPYFLDIELPSDILPLSEPELLTLRASAARFLRGKSAKELAQGFQARTSIPAVPSSLSALWVQQLILVFCRRLSLDSSVQSAGQELLLHAEQEAAARQNNFKQALRILLDPESYKLIDKPGSVDEASKLLDSYIGFQYSPEKGTYKNRSIILIKESGILKLIGTESESNIRSLLDELEARGIFLKHDNVKFSDGKTQRFYWLDHDATKGSSIQVPRFQGSSTSETDIQT